MSEFTVEFFNHAVLDRAASQQAGRRIHKEAVYMKVKHKGFTDYVSRAATDEDKMAHPEAWARYQLKQQGQGGTGVDKLPSWTPLIEADLRGLGITTLEELSRAEVPADLEYLKLQANTILELKEQANGNSKVA